MDARLPPLERFHVVGTSGAGKSTFAAALAAVLGLRYVELDDLAWGPEWQLRPSEVVCAELRALLEREPGWVVDGNYSALRDEVIWPWQPTVVWLDYSFATIMRRLSSRTVRRVITGTPLWRSGNRETLGRALFSRESILWWATKTYARRRREYPSLFAAHPELALIRFRRPRQAQRWLRELAALQEAAQ